MGTSTYPAEALRKALRRYLDTLAVNVPQRTVHVDHRNNMEVSSRMPEKESVEKCAQTEQKAHGEQQAAHTYDDDSGLEVRELEVFTRYTVVSDLKKSL